MSRWNWVLHQAIEHGHLAEVCKMRNPEEKLLFEIPIYSRSAGTKSFNPMEHVKEVLGVSYDAPDAADYWQRAHQEGNRTLKEQQQIAGWLYIMAEKDRLNGTCFFIEPADPSSKEDKALESSQNLPWHAFEMQVSPDDSSEKIYHGLNQQIQSILERVSFHQYSFDLRAFQVTGPWINWKGLTLEDKPSG